MIIYVSQTQKWQKDQSGKAHYRDLYVPHALFWMAWYIYIPWSINLKTNESQQTILIMVSCMCKTLGPKVESKNKWHYRYLTVHWQLFMCVFVCWLVMMRARPAFFAISIVGLLIIHSSRSKQRCEHSWTDTTVASNVKSAIIR